jgi:hypothetical protein
MRANFATPRLLLAGAFAFQDRNFHANASAWIRLAFFVETGGAGTARFSELSAPLMDFQRPLRKLSKRCLSESLKTIRPVSAPEMR